MRAGTIENTHELEAQLRLSCFYHLRNRVAEEVNARAPSQSQRRGRCYKRNPTGKQRIEGQRGPSDNDHANESRFTARGGQIRSRMSLLRFSPTTPRKNQKLLFFSDRTESVRCPLGSPRPSSACATPWASFLFVRVCPGLSGLSGRPGLSGPPDGAFA